MGFGDFLKNLKAIANVELRFKYIEKEMEELKKKVESVYKDNELYKIKKEALDSLHITTAKNTHKELLDEVYDRLWEKIKSLPDDTDIEIVLGIQNSSVRKFWNTWEDRHCARETDPSLMKLLILATTATISYVKDNYMETFCNTFTENKGEERYSQMEKYITFIKREFYSKFDEEFDNLVEIVKVFK